MPVTPITAAPFILEHPSVIIGDQLTGVAIDCAGTNLTVGVDQDENTIETYCGTYTSYKPPKWTVTFTLVQSYGAGSTWELIHPLCGTEQPFAIKPDIATASVDNPVMTGTCIVKHLPFIDAPPGEASEVDLELKVQGQPAWGETDPTATTAQSAAA